MKPAPASQPPAAPAALFPTITGAHWLAAFARAKTEGNAVSRRIRRKLGIAQTDKRGRPVKASS